MTDKKYTLGIDIGSTTVKIAILDEENQLLFADYERHFANIQETLAHLLGEAHEKLGELTLQPVITGSGGLALANHLGIPFTQEVIAVSTSLKALAPQTDVAIELGGEDAKIIYFEGGNVEQRMNGICAGGTGSFIDQMASLLQTDATGLNEYAKHYQAIYPIAARCGVCLLYTSDAADDMQHAAVYSQKPISSRSSTTVQQKRIFPLPFSRQLSTRPFLVLPAVNRSAATLPFSAARCTSSRN